MMNLRRLTVSVFSFAIIAGSTVFAQNSAVVSAALEFKKYQPALMQQDFEKAKDVLMEAKSLIDPAMEHESTADDAKANYYNAAIYFSLIELSGTGQFEELEVYQNDSITDIIEKSAKKANKKTRWKRELEDFFNLKTVQAIQIGELMFKQKNYQMAFAGFAGAYQIKKIADIEKDRDNMRLNAIVSAQHVIDTLSRTDKLDEAIEFASNALEMFPESEDIAIAGVNVALQTDDLEKAEEFFNVAAEASPNNKELFSSMGSIYLTTADKLSRELAELDVTDEAYAEKSEQVDDLYEKGENNLKRALEIDGEYAEAAYNLGVLYLGQGEKLKTKAAQMEFNDPDYEATSNESLEMYKKAIDPLEVYIKQDPENSGVLQVLFQVYRNAGDDEKALEYKRRADKAAAEGK